MRVLYVSHDFLPAHAAGTEIYTWHLAKRVAERGHEAHVFTTEKDVSRPNLSLARREWDGLPVHELVNNLFYEDFRETWDWPPAVEAFGRVLDELSPDVVHVMHLLYLSAGCVEEAARRGIPVVYTLHDFWLTCARFGHRYDADGEVCHTVDFERCGRCLARFPFAQSPLARRTARVLERVRSTTGLDLKGPAQGAVALLQGGSRGAAPPPDPERVQRMAELARRRDEELRRRIVPRVARFFAPSRFLRQRFLEWGLRPDAIEQLDYGLELGPFEGFQRTPSEEVRVAFLGTLAAHKGVHLLLDAWARLSPSARERGRLTIHGSKARRTEYVAALEARAKEVGASLPGALPREAVPAALAETDLLVVPSVWFENQPLTILEARATRTPLLVSDFGGMAELVEEGVHGWRFAVGDAADLAAKLEPVLTDPDHLQMLSGADPVKDMRTSAAEMEERYRALVASTTGGRS